MEKKNKILLAIIAGAIATIIIVASTLFVLSQKDNEKHETFTVYSEYEEQPENITVYDISFPLDESEAMMVYRAVIDHKPEWPSFFDIYKTDEVWVIQDGQCLPIGGGGVIIRINQENRTINISKIICL